MSLDLGKVRGLVFDLDGTLIDSYRAITDSLNHALEAEGLEPLPESRVRGMVGLGLETLVARVLGPAKVADGVRRFRGRYAQVCEERTTLLPQVADTLTVLAERGYRMVVATNKPAYFATRLLKALGIGDRFESVFGPDNVENRKPHPEMVFRALEALGVGSTEALCVGDMEVDIEMARAAGVPVIVLPTGSRDAASLEKHGPDLMISSFDQLLDHLQGVEEHP